MNDDHNDENLTEKNTGSLAIWLIAYPLIITNATNTIMQFVDRKFLAMHSTEEVSAALPGGVLSFLMFTFFLITVGFTAAIVAQNFGKKNFLNCARVPWAGFYFSLIAGIICSYLLIPAGVFFIHLGKHPPDLQMRELEYFKIMMTSGGFIFISTAFSAFFSGRGKTWIIVCIQLIANSVNIILDYCLIFGYGGFPEMGISGAALATVIASAVAASIAFSFFIFQNQKKFPTRNDWFFRFDDLKRLLKFGAPSGIEVAFSVSGFTFLIFLIGRMGTVQLAASTIVFSINMLVFMPLLSTSEAVGILTGKVIGAGNPQLASKIPYKALRFIIFYIIFVAIVYFFFSQYIVAFFSPNNGGGNEFAAVAALGGQILIIMSVGNFFDAIKFMFLGALRGAGDTTASMFILIGTSWCILIPGSFLIVEILHFDIIYLWLFIISYAALNSFFIWLRFKVGAWKKINMFQEFDTLTEQNIISAIDNDAESPHL